MKVTELRTKPSGMVAFILRSQKRVPEKEGCYILASPADDILYIGQTVNLRRRMGDHRKDRKKTDPGNGIYPRKFFWLESVTSEKLENEWITNYRAIEGKLPPLNKVQAAMLGL